MIERDVDRLENEIAETEVTPDTYNFMLMAEVGFERKSVEMNIEQDSVQMERKAC